jgi:hypothetical protein
MGENKREEMSTLQIFKLQGYDYKIAYTLGVSEVSPIFFTLNGGDCGFPCLVNSHAIHSIYRLFHY